MYTVDNNKCDDWFEVVTINNKKVNFKLDSGAQCNLISLNLATQLNANIRRSNINNIISYNGEKTIVVGECELSCQFTNRGTCNIQFLLVELESTPILGKNTCVSMNFIRRVHMVQNEDIYTGLGCIKNFQYELDIIKDPTFDIKQARQIPYVIRAEVKSELDNMEKLIVIEKQTEATPVVSNLVIVRKNNKIRLCIDPTDVNKNIMRRHHPLKTVEEISAQLEGSSWFTLLDCKRGFWQIQIVPNSQK